ncbi:MAG: hypothetical protein ACI9SE_004706 [Neolewinella sp.]|jgi:hypothetical protein
MRTALVALCALSMLGCVAPQPRPATTNTTFVAPEGPAGELPDDGADWVRLTSGEWLKGKVLGLRRNQLQFKSAVLKEATIPWSKVAELHSRRTVTILLDGREPASGVLSVRGEQAKLDGASKQVFDRRELLIVLPGQDQSTDCWSGKLSWSLTKASGNTSRLESSLLGKLSCETANTRGEANYTGTQSEANSIKTSDQTRADGRYDVFVSDRLFLTPLSFEYFRDPFQNIEQRITPSAGLGYEFFQRGGVELNINLSAGWQRTELVSLQPGRSNATEEATGVFGTQLDWDLSDSVDLEFQYEIQANIERVTDYNHKMRATVSVDLWDNLDLDVSAFWNRTSEPEQLASGAMPDPDDYRLTIGLGWSF